MTQDLNTFHATQEGILFIVCERLGVGVTPDANLNAPNSLTHSARDTQRRAEDHGRKAAA